MPARSVAVPPERAGGAATVVLRVTECGYGALAGLAGAATVSGDQWEPKVH
jgi:hypothetical protein